MVRVDVLEQVNKILQFYNYTDKPFGRKQVIVFGDIFQLPPVVKSDERAGILDKYGNVYFFNSNAYCNGIFKIKELRKIYRQTNRTFIDILNTIREGTLPKEYEIILNQHYVAEAPDCIVQLVVNNQIREEINRKNLEKINKKEKELTYIKENCVKQFPVILAYAVTIHKSQGMTYQELFCDLDGCFAAGQAYVALSRCVSLETLCLIHKVYQKDVFTNSEIMNFYNEQIKTSVLIVCKHYASILGRSVLL